MKRLVIILLAVLVFGFTSCLHKCNTYKGTSPKKPKININK